MSEPCRILEYTTSARVEAVDREKGIIRGVKLLGERSANAAPNDHDYPPATREKAIRLLEGLRVGINHPQPGGPSVRPYDDLFGIVRNVREGGDGLYGDYHFPPDHPRAKQLCWDADNNPRAFGFSINGDGRKKREGGRTLVEEIVALDSVDLVTRPATTRGLFESHTMTTKVKVSALIESLKATRPGYSRALREMAEAGLMSPDATMDEPAPRGPDVPEAADHETALKQGFRAAINAALDDDSMDLKAKIKKIKEILTMEEKMLARNAGDATPSDPATGEATESLRRERSAYKLLAEKGIKVTPVVEMAVTGCRTEADVQRLVESLSVPPANGKPGAQSAAPPAPPSKVQEQQTAPAADPDEARKKRVASLRSGF